jgi:hypothetical protein
MIHSTAPRTASLRAARRQRAEKLARAQAGAVSRRQLYAAGFTRAEVRANVAARRWQLVVSTALQSWSFAALEK